MNTVHRAYGLRFAIYVADHEPPHVHAFSSGATVKIIIPKAGEQPEVVWNRGMKHGDLHRVKQEVADKREMLLDAWREIHR